MEKVTELRRLVYNTLTLGNEEEDTRDINLTQLMGLSMTKAISKDGVHLVQIQSVIDRKVAYNLVEVLKILDGLEEEVIEVKQLPMSENHLDDLDRAVKLLVQEELSLKEFKKVTKRQFVVEVLNQSESNAEAANKLKIQKAYLPKLKKDLEIH